MKREFTVIIERDEESDLYIGEVPGIPGCHSQGKTIDELLKNMKEVIELCLEEYGNNIVKPNVVGIQTVEVNA